MVSPKVLVIDAGLGNIGSVVAALNRHNCSTERRKQVPPPQSALAYTHAVLPGVGSFAAGMDALQKSGWESWIKEVWCTAEKPFLGICLGMQLLATRGNEGSTEGLEIPGLNLIPGEVTQLDIDRDLALPHVGWNSLYWHKTTSPISFNVKEGGDMYFVHSYAFKTQEKSDSLAYSNYGKKFTAVVGRGSCYGVQFHPEKSQRLGFRVLENFLNLPSC